MAWGFGSKKPEVFNTEIDIKFPLDILIAPFVKWFIIDLYKHVLSDCYGKAVGVKKEDDAMFWDSYIFTQQPKGLITLLAEAMAQKQRVILVYKTGIVSVADAEEKAEAERLLKDKKLPKNTAICDFTNFEKTDLLKQYGSLIYNVLSTCNTGLNITKALQIKIAELRKTIAENDSDSAIRQGKTIAASIKDGKAVMLDSGDEVVIPAFDIATTEKSIGLINGLIVNALGGFPLSYVNGALASGSFADGEADSVAINRALQFYFNSIFRPVTQALTGEKNITFKEDNAQKLSSLANIISVVEGTGLLSEEQKQKFIEGYFK